MNLARSALALMVAALAGCASTPPELQTGVQCIEHRHGTATVTATGIVVAEGRCTSWRIGPTKREIGLWNAAHPAK